MAGFSVTLTENVTMTELRRSLAKAAKTADDPGKALRSLGRHMAFTSVPQNFKEGGRPVKWARLKRRQGQPLLDTGKLLRSVGFEVSGKSLALTAGGSAYGVEYARLQDQGGTIVPVRAKWLMLPLSPPLTATEARVRRPRDFAGAFFLFKGPEGPGLYRKSRLALSSSIRTRKTTYSRRKSEQKGIERIFEALKRVVVPPRRYLMFQQEDLEYGAYLLFAAAFPDLVKSAPQPRIAAGIVLGSSMT